MFLGEKEHLQTRAAIGLNIKGAKYCSTASCHDDETSLLSASIGFFLKFPEGNRLNTNEQEGSSGCDGNVLKQHCRDGCVIDYII